MFTGPEIQHPIRFTVLLAAALITSFLVFRTTSTEDAAPAAPRLGLGYYVKDARLTGTGSCVFAPMTDATRAAAVLAGKPHEWQGWVTHGLNRSPLTARLQFERQVGRG